MKDKYLINNPVFAYKLFSTMDSKLLKCQIMEKNCVMKYGMSEIM